MLDVPFLDYEGGHDCMADLAFSQDLKICSGARIDSQRTDIVLLNVDLVRTETGAPLDRTKKEDTQRWCADSLIRAITTERQNASAIDHADPWTACGEDSGQPLLTKSFRKEQTRFSKRCRAAG